MIDILVTEENLEHTYPLYSAIMRHIHPGENVLIERNGMSYVVGCNVWNLTTQGFIMVHRQRLPGVYVIRFEGTQTQQMRVPRMFIEKE